MFILALGVHGAIVVMGAIFERDVSWDVKEPPVELDLADKLGDPDVRELVVADTPPPEDQPTPPPDTPPPDDTPPPQEDPDMADPEQTPPPPTPKPAAKPAAPKSSPPPANAKHGPVAVEGVVGGNPAGTKATGNPGGLKVSSVGWKTPHPPYPAQARMAHVTGSTSVRITTDASGTVTSVVITKSAGSAILDSNTQSYVKMNWKGPPNSTHDTEFVYQLQ
jgi:protein TonB